MSVTAIVSVDLPGPQISRHLYGHFAEHLGRCVYGGIWVGEDSEIPNVRGIRSDVVAALREIQIPNLRWPGGCFADEYHWRDGIGPRSERPRMVNTHWGDVVEDNSFGSHEFLDLCEQLGAEPYICGNVGSGTVQEMSQWVEYLTRPGTSPMADLRRSNGRDEPWRVPWWGLGNESWGCGGSMRVEHYADLARQFATYCRDHGDNRLHRIAGGASGDDYHWTEVLMRSQGDLGCGCHRRNDFQSISLHYYTVVGPWEHKGSATRFSDAEYWTCLARAAAVDRLLQRHSTVMDCYDPDRRVGLVLDEWGTWHDVEEGTNPGFLYQQNTVRDALVAALHFDAFHRHAGRLRMANIAQTVNVLQSVLLTDGDALVRTPTYHVFWMNRGHHDADSLPVVLRSVPTREVDGAEVALVSSTASRRGDEVLLSLTNLDLERPVEVCYELCGGTVTGATGLVLTADTPQAHNTAADPDRVVPRPLPVTVQPGTVRVTLPPAAYATVLCLTA